MGNPWTRGWDVSCGGMVKVNSTLKLHGCSVSNPERDGVDKAADGPSFFWGAGGQECVAQTCQSVVG